METEARVNHLYYKEGLNQSEVARRLNISRQRVHQIISKGKKRIWYKTIVDLKAMRQERGLFLDDVVSVVGIPKTTLRDIEIGTRTNERNAMNLSKFYEIPFEKAFKPVVFSRDEHGQIYEIDII